MMVSGEHLQKPPEDHNRIRRRRCCVCCLISTLIAVVVLVLIIVILAFTVFKPKKPTATVLSVTVDGVSPRITFPVFRIELNVTLRTRLLVKNPNAAAFEYDPGRTLLLFGGDQVGIAMIPKGTMPAEGSEIIETEVTVEADKFATNPQLINQVIAGGISMETQSRVSGTVRFLGIFRRKTVVMVNCQLKIGIPGMDIQRQECTQTYS